MEDETTAQPHAPQDDAGGGGESPARELIVMRVGGLAVGVYADEADNVSEGLRATPLPHAPPAVLGVVCVRGRMRTLLYPPALLDEDEGAGAGRRALAASEVPRFVVALRGDEQLALAVERVERIVAVPASNLRPHEPAGGVVRGTVEYEGADVFVLDPARMFDAATRHAERRRPRALG